MKQTFGITAALEQLGRRQLAVAGAETDVCVLQSVLGLRELGYDVLLLEDCQFSSDPDVEAALRRMYTAGTIPSTYKSIISYSPFLKDLSGSNESLAVFREKPRRGSRE